MTNRLLPLASLLIAACASSPPARIPEWEAVPLGIVNAVCERLALERASSDASVAVVAKTAPIITTASLRALAREYDQSGSVMPLDVMSQAAGMPITLEGAACRWTPIAEIDPTRDVATQVVQISRPIVNPFARSEAGVFARFSVGGRDAQWYWVPIAERKGVWFVGYVMPLAVME